jgi:hypothetical protein
VASRWIFDVGSLPGSFKLRGDRAKVEELIFELPLMQWEDVTGSKLHATDFLRAVSEIDSVRSRNLG